MIWTEKFPGALHCNQTLVTGVTQLFGFDHLALADTFELKSCVADRSGPNDDFGIKEISMRREHDVVVF